MQEVKTLFQEKFGSVPTHMVQAPGRLELLGNHTDYNQGLVMSLAVDRYIHIASGPRNDGQVELVSSAFPNSERFPFDRIEKNTRAPWANYVKGVLLQLRQRNVRFTGFNAAIHGTIPLGAGMSSSAALEVATALTVRKLFPYTLTETGGSSAVARDANGQLPVLQKAEKMALAKVCQAAENLYVGANTGLLDQISSLFGKAGHIIQIDFKDLSVEHAPMVSGFSVVVCDSGVKHNLAAGEYNELRSHCESAARTLGVPSLRSVDAASLAANERKLSERDYQCAYHIVGENQRVMSGQKALSQGDIDQFGQFLFQSHESSRDYFKNSCPELDILVELARKQNGCVGARLTGGGFGGATINLVRATDVKSFSEALKWGYKENTGRDLGVLVCQIVNGAE